MFIGIMGSYSFKKKNMVRVNCSSLISRNSNQIVVIDELGFISSKFEAIVHKIVSFEKVNDCNFLISF